MNLDPIIRHFFSRPESAWSFSTSSGGELTLGRKAPLTIGATAGTLYLKQNRPGGPGRRLHYLGIGGGVSFGPGEGSATLWTSTLPGTGLSSIRIGPLAQGPDLTEDDFLFSGFLLDLGYATTTRRFVRGRGWGATLTMVFLGMPHTIFNGTYDALNAILGMYKAVGLLVGTSVGSQGGASVMGYSSFFFPPPLGE